MSFLDIENPNAPCHPVFNEDTSCLPFKVTRKELQSNPTKKKLQEKEQGKAGTTDANKLDEIPVGKMKIEKNRINFIKRFGIINVGEYIAITGKSKQQEHAKKRHPTATTTNEKIGSSQAIKPRRGTGKTGPDKRNRKHCAITDEEFSN